MATPWIDIANKLVGTKETKGKVDNPDILEMFRLSGHGWVKDDETAWCAAFVGACLKLSGFAGTGRLNARSYLDFGEKLTKPKQGCVVVFWRGSKSGDFGHVGFYAGETDKSIKVLGGNQSSGSTEAVNIKTYPKTRLLGYRWPVDQTSIPTDTSLPTIDTDVVPTPPVSSSIVVSSASSSAAMSSATSNGLPKEFFDSVRGSLFAGSLSQSAVDNMNQIVSHWVENYSDNPTNQLAYILATVLAEVGSNMKPVRESFAATDEKARYRVRNRKYGKPTGPYGHVYYGRGYVQLTWLSNYRKQSAKLGIDLVQYPDRALETETALQILADGMLAGDFSGTGHGLGYYVNASKQDFVGARYTVNVQDRAGEIAGYAKQFLIALNRAQAVAGNDFGVNTSVVAVGIPTRSPTRIGGEGRTETDFGQRDEIRGTEDRTRSVIRDIVLTLAANKLRKNGKGKLADAIQLILGKSTRASMETRLPEGAIAAAITSELSDNAQSPETKPASNGNSTLTPINAALGVGIGNLLNGKKTGLGIAGLLAAVLIPEFNPELAELLGMGNTGIESAGVENVTEQVQSQETQSGASGNNNNPPETNATGGDNPPVGNEATDNRVKNAPPGGENSSETKANLWLPIFSALSAWGVLGKAEKWVHLIAAVKRK